VTAPGIWAQARKQSVACSWESARWGATAGWQATVGPGGGVQGLVELKGSKVGQGQRRLQLGYLNPTRALFNGRQPGVGLGWPEELVVMPSNLEGGFWMREC